MNFLLYCIGVGLGFLAGVLVTLWCVGFVLLQRKRRAGRRVVRP